VVNAMISHPQDVWVGIPTIPGSCFRRYPTLILYSSFPAFWLIPLIDVI
jgi:hypothetical protein